MDCDDIRFIFTLVLPIVYFGILEWQMFHQIELGGDRVQNDVKYAGYTTTAIGGCLLVIVSPCLIRKFR